MMGTTISSGLFLLSRVLLLLLSLLSWNSQAAGKSVGVCVKLRGERESQQEERPRY